MENSKDICGIQMRFFEKAGMVFGDSPDMRGLLLVGSSVEDIETKAPAAIATMLIVGGLGKALLEKLDERVFLRMNNDILKIMEARATASSLPAE